MTRGPSHARWSPARSGWRWSEGGPKDAPTIVFIHGYPDTKEEWDPVRERLEPSFQPWPTTSEGAGASTAPRRAASYDFDRLGDDLEAVLDALAPGKRVHLVGHDWGGLQGWEFATSAPVRGPACVIHRGRGSGGGSGHRREPRPAGPRAGARVAAPAAALVVHGIPADARRCRGSRGASVRRRSGGGGCSGSPDGPGRRRIPDGPRCAQMRSTEPSSIAATCPGACGARGSTPWRTCPSS